RRRSEVDGPSLPEWDHDARDRDLCGFRCDTGQPVYETRGIQTEKCVAECEVDVDRGCDAAFTVRLSDCDRQIPEYLSAGIACSTESDSQGKCLTLLFPLDGQRGLSCEQGRIDNPPGRAASFRKDHLLIGNVDIETVEATSRHDRRPPTLSSA